MQHVKKIAPSLLSADFSNLSAEISKVEKAGADLLHLDIMDGHFVPNLTIGPVVVSAIHHCTDLILDCHLMIDYPEKFLDAFIKAGADMISFHCETKSASPDILQHIKAAGKKGGIALNPDSSLTRIEPFLSHADYIVIMSVQPGFGGQKFLEKTTSRIKQIAGIRLNQNFSFEIEVDGGINTHNIHDVAKAGADILVAGSAIFESKNCQETISKMKAKLYG